MKYIFFFYIFILLYRVFLIEMYIQNIFFRILFSLKDPTKNSLGEVVYYFYLLLSMNLVLELYVINTTLYFIKL